MRKLQITIKKNDLYIPHETIKMSSLSVQCTDNEPLAVTTSVVCIFTYGVTGLTSRTKEGK
jgi:hypothetical protein